MRTLFSVLLLLALVTPIRARSAEVRKTPESAPAAAMDALLAGKFRADQPGAVVLVVRDGRTLFRKAYGLASVELGVPVKPDTVFRIASTTKQFTAAAVLKLVEEGRVELKTPIRRCLPELPAGWAAITVEHLLTHTSGLWEYSRAPDFSMQEPVTPAGLIARLEGRLLEFEPGTRFAYNNSGYILLGLLVERLSGQPYETFLKERFLQPLGLKHTAFPNHGELVAGLASPYSSGPRPAPVVSPSPAGGLVSNADDLAAWTLALHGGKVLSPASLQAMTTPFHLKDGQDTRYGLGMRIGELHGQPYIHHSGDNPGYHVQVAALPRSRVAVVVLMNGEEGDVSPEFLAKRLAALAIGQPLTEPTPAVVSVQALQALVGRYRSGDAVRTIRLRDGHLYSVLGEGPPGLIQPLSSTEFFFPDNSDLHLRFALEAGRAVAVTRLSDGGAPQVFLREPAESKP
jgi:D-alanyl-D-alanine carboxypeptidase